MAAAQIKAETIREARELLLRMHHKAGVGHIGGNLSVLEILLMLFLEIRKPQDMIVLSKGHSAGALYVTLAMSGIIPIDELDSFHQEGTRLPGHPPVNTFDDVPFATGSLGHGLPLAVGLAMGSYLAGQEDKQVYCVMSDGEWQEGANWEAAWFAGHHAMKNLTILIDVNGLQGFGTTLQIGSMHNLAQRIEAQGIETCVIDGHSLSDLRKALRSTDKRIGSRAVLCNTIKGNGVPGYEGRMESHYDPLSDDALDQALKLLTDMPL